MSGSNPFDYPWWLASRSAGIVAFVALTGRMTSLRWTNLGRRANAPPLVDIRDV
jgi:hypothetical protein